MSDHFLLKRRSFLLTATAVATAGNVPAKPTAVSVVRAPSYNGNLIDIIGRILREHRVDVREKRVVLKPNLVEFDARAPINTNPIFVASAAEAFARAGAKEVIIAEGPGHRRTTLDLAMSAGYFESIPHFERRFIDLNLDEVTRIKIDRPFSSLSDLYLPHTVLACDLLVSLPKMKTHHWAGATLSMKNLFGVVPGAVYGWPKNVLHWAGIDESIADLYGLFPRQFCIVDGIEAMEGNGPILGRKKTPGLIVAGEHPPSVDATCCRIMRIDPHKIAYLNLVAQRTPARFIQQIGETPRAVEAAFALPPGLDHLRLDV